MTKSYEIERSSIIINGLGEMSKEATYFARPRGIFLRDLNEKHGFFWTFNPYKLRPSSE